MIYRQKSPISAFIKFGTLSNDQDLMQHFAVWGGLIKKALLGDHRHGFSFLTRVVNPSIMTCFVISSSKAISKMSSNRI